ncbi:MAG: hypothetical protein M3405_04110 [Acidobacteriota bacterium]|nr:hypothetical protein [Acidobacteriota bacterium]
MKILSPKIHGYLDFVVVIAFALAPTIFGLTGLAATLAYVLAVVHLALTLLTAFPLGVVGLVPFTIHGWIELLVSVGLVALPFIAGFSDIPVARNFYIVAGVVVFVTWLISNYKAAETVPA